jgi:hypothetical protein
MGISFTACSLGEFYQQAVSDHGLREIATARCHNVRSVVPPAGEHGSMLLFRIELAVLIAGDHTLVRRCAGAPSWLRKYFEFRDFSAAR